MHCGWVPDDQRTAADMLPRDIHRKSRRLRGIWTAFAIAPSVGPLLFSLVVFTWLFAPDESQRSSTSAGFVGIPIYLLAFGLPVAYFVAGAICLPVFFSLERSNNLGGFVISVIAILAWWLFAAASCFVQMMFGGIHPLLTIRGTVFLAIGLSPFAWASSLTFAWIVRSSERGVSIRSLMILLTILALIFAFAAPAFRAFYFRESP